MKEEDASREQEPELALTTQQTKLMTALVCNPDMQAAADAVGVSRTTAYRWLRQPGFQEELRRQRDEGFAEAMATVKTGVKGAVDGLLGLLDVEDARLRRQVCNDILGHALKVHELEDVERRLKALEEAMKERNGERA